MVKKSMLLCALLCSSVAMFAADKIIKVTTELCGPEGKRTEMFYLDLGDTKKFDVLCKDFCIRCSLIECDEYKSRWSMTMNGGDSLKACPSECQICEPLCMAWGEELYIQCPCADYSLTLKCEKCEESCCYSCGDRNDC